MLFFPRGHGFEFSNLIGSLRGPDFPISAHENGSAYMNFRPFVYKAIKVLRLSSNDFFLDKKVEKNKAFFSKQIFITIFQRFSVVFLSGT